MEKSISFGQTHDIKVIVKALVQADIDVDEIYYARQDLENSLRTW